MDEMLIFTQPKIDVLKLNLIVFGKTALISLNGCNSLAANYNHYFCITSINKLSGGKENKKVKEKNWTFPRLYADKYNIW